MWRVRARQTKLLLWKNTLLARRNLTSTIIQILVPLAFVALLFLFSLALEANSRRDSLLRPERSPDRIPFHSFPRCISSDSSTGPCLTLVYAVNVPPPSLAHSVVQQISSNHNIPPSQIREFPTVGEMDSYLLRVRNATQGGYVFNVTDDGSGGTLLEYSVMYNETETTSFGVPIDPVEYTLLPLTYAVQQALLQVVAGPGLEYSADILPFAHPELVSFDIIGAIGPSFFFAAIMFSFVIQLGRIVAEKEAKLREGMNQMGLKDSSYWASWMIFNVAFNVASILVLCASGALFQFSFFLLNDFRTYFLLFLLFGLAMVPMAFFVSTLVSREQTATTLGFLLFLFGVIIGGAQDFIYAKSTAAIYKILFSLLPFVLLSKGMADLSAKSDNADDSGMRWSERSSNADFALDSVYNWLIADFFIYTILALYADNVLPSSFGVSRSPFYFLSPAYWTGNVSASRETSIRRRDEVYASRDANVVAEYEMARNNTYPDNTAIALYDLQKTFKSRHGCCWARSRSFTAVDGLNYHIESGQVWVLLGHNGAGKSTTIGMLTGLTAPSGGEAEIFGNSIRANMPGIRSMMGVCPQHDILWPELTGREHLTLFAGLKGLPEEAVQAEVDARLEDVNLSQAGDLTTSAYSGGMQRRLSCTIAFIGDPAVVFLDEPTSGLGPLYRRRIWELIQSKKDNDRIIVLTTHSMEEADVLGDTIAIMAGGQLATLGTSLRLKNEYGTGYKLTVIPSHDADKDRILDFFQTELSVQPIDSATSTTTFVSHSANANAIYFVVPRDRLSSLGSFFRSLESSSHSLGIVDVQLAMSSLESVFLQVAEIDEEGNDKGRTA